MAALIERTLLDVGGRAVHLRRAGTGAPLLMFHQSPKTSEELVPLMTELAETYHVIAPDTPGYGLSDPLPIKRPTMTDLTDGVVTLMDTLGIEKAYVYGIHTGAKIALGLAARHPGRVAGLVANGVLVNARADRQDLASRYLPPFEAKDDGSHLMEGWHRMREQRVFFPWYDRRDSARMPISVGDAPSVHAAFMDFAAAGSTYSKAYGAALGLNIKGILPLLSVPTLITCGPHDVLLEDVKRLAGSGSVRVEPANDDTHLVALMRAHYGGAGALPDHQVPAAKTPRRLLAPVMRGGLHGFAGGADGGPKIFVVPALGSSVMLDRETLAPLATRAQILALDPAGFGHSDFADDVVGGLLSAAAEFEPDTVLAFGTGAALGEALYQGLGTAKTRLFVDPITPKDPLAFEGLIPDLTPEDGGGHLMRAWWAAREGQKFLPWFNADHAYAIPSDGRLVAADVHERAMSLLRGWEQGRSLLAEALAFAPPAGAIVLRSDWMLAHPQIACTESADDQYVMLGEEDLAIALSRILFET